VFVLFILFNFFTFKHLKKKKEKEKDNYSCQSDGKTGATQKLFSVELAGIRGHFFVR
jgi:hypothetical protein